MFIEGIGQENDEFPVLVSIAFLGEQAGRKKRNTDG